MNQFFSFVIFIVFIASDPPVLQNKILNQVMND